MREETPISLRKLRSGSKLGGTHWRQLRSLRMNPTLITLLAIQQGVYRTMLRKRI
jgi:hypothetical protein